MSVQAQKGNKILRISEDSVQKYLSMGYNIVGFDGTVLQKAVPSDNNQLKLEYAKLSEEVDSLKATIQSLEVKNKALTQENKKLTKELEEAKATPVEKPTRKRKSQATETETVVEEVSE